MKSKIYIYSVTLSVFVIKLISDMRQTFHSSEGEEVIGGTVPNMLLIIFGAVLVALVAFAAANGIVWLYDRFVKQSKKEM